MLAQKYVISVLLHDILCIFPPRDGYIDPTTQFPWSGKGVDFLWWDRLVPHAIQILTHFGFWGQTHYRMFPGECEGIYDELFQLWWRYSLSFNLLHVPLYQDLYISQLNPCHLFNDDLMD